MIFFSSAFEPTGSPNFTHAMSTLSELGKTVFKITKKYKNKNKKKKIKSARTSLNRIILRVSHFFKYMHRGNQIYLGKRI